METQIYTEKLRVLEVSLLATVRDEPRGRNGASETSEQDWQTGLQVKSTHPVFMSCEVRMVFADERLQSISW